MFQAMYRHFFCRESLRFTAGFACSIAGMALIGWIVQNLEVWTWISLVLMVAVCVWDQQYADDMLRAYYGRTRPLTPQEHTLLPVAKCMEGVEMGTSLVAISCICRVIWEFEHQGHLR